jgi:hypothetical protein
MSLPRSTRPHYVANVPHVREVSLLGTGPDGDSRLLIAADMRFIGVPFREVSLSILTGENERAARAGLELRALLGGVG